MTPTKFGRYDLLERIGGGGMAEVFKARSSGVAGFEKIIAIKRILPALASDSEFVALFIEEAKISAGLTHGNISQVFEFGQIENTYFLAMEFIHGQDLRGILKQFTASRKTMPVPLAVHIVVNISAALAYAHGRKDSLGHRIGVVHRDVGPPNVLISYEGAVKLIDFGIAKAKLRNSHVTGNLAGNFSYMAPEQAGGKPIDHRADLFAVGSILYECVVGKRPFVADTDLGVLERVRHGDFVPPCQANTRVPRPLEQIILKAMKTDPEERYQSAEELQRALESFVQASRLNFSTKQLSRWMKTTFATDLSREGRGAKAKKPAVSSPGASATASSRGVPFRATDPMADDLGERPRRSTLQGFDAGRGMGSPQQASTMALPVIGEGGIDFAPIPSPRAP
ncbi:MAG: serine/threonine protein kinase, partial [Deltaproteobacteria bacterium]|nr:serine/threonine protein kinase [Deltaproteobacteria bacterium]